MRYYVWNDSDSRKEVYKEFDDLDLACEFASDFVHQFDGADFRVIAHVEDVEGDETIDTYENINPCDGALYEMFKTDKI